jgi:heme/copper-type cytochrome/quinol oxidase subunit 2
MVASAIAVIALFVILLLVVALLMYAVYRLWRRRNDDRPSA